MTPSELEQAAFWEYYVCIDCYTQGEAVPESEWADRLCPECGSTNVVQATSLQRFLEDLQAE